jgi:DNA repair protein RecO (recombination protein O)
MPSSDIDGIVLRSVRYGEADAVLTLYTLERGRVSAIAKGARRPKSSLGARAQPGVRIAATLHRGRGELERLGDAALLEPNAGIWARADRLRAAGSILESAYRILPEEDPSPEAYSLLTRAMGQLSRAPAHTGPADHHPIVLGVRAKLIVVSGLLPRLGQCADCVPGARLVAFGAPAGGALCQDCSGLGQPIEPSALDAFAQLVGRPLSQAFEAVGPRDAAMVDAMIAEVLEYGLGIRAERGGWHGGGSEPRAVRNSPAE